MRAPTVPMEVDVAAADMDTQLIAVCKQIMGDAHGDKSWRAATSADIEVRQIQGGITNMLYRVSLREGAQDVACSTTAVLVRVFGKAGDVVCDRKAENEAFAELGRIDFGPKLHGLFGNGRVEGWLHGRRPLEPLEMLETKPVNFQALNARKLAEMHMTCKLPSSTEVWAQLHEWLALAEKVEFPDDPKKEARLRQLDPFPRFAQEVEALKKVLPSPLNGYGKTLLEGTTGVERRAREILYETRFCHLDLLSGNIMYSEEHGDVRFIDFEYAMNSYVGLDVANHFNAVPESCLILENTFDVDKYYPGPALQTTWLQAYLEARKIPFDDDLLAALLKVVIEFSCLAELRWVVWGVVQAGSSPVDFDYLEYTKMRFEQGFLRYKAWRDEGRP